MRQSTTPNCVPAPTTATLAASAIMAAAAIALGHTPLLHFFKHLGPFGTLLCRLFDYRVDSFVHLVADILFKISSNLGHQWDPEHDGDQRCYTRKDEHQGCEDHDAERELVCIFDDGQELPNIDQLPKVKAQGPHERDQRHDIDNLSRCLDDQMLPS